MVRRTVSLPRAIDELVRESARDKESYSAAVARLIEAGALALREGRAPSWIGAGESKGGPRDFARHYERYLDEALKTRGS